MVISMRGDSLLLTSDGLATFRSRINSVIKKEFHQNFEGSKSFETIGTSLLSGLKFANHLCSLKFSNCLQCNSNEKSKAKWSHFYSDWNFNWNIANACDGVISVERSKLMVYSIRKKETVQYDGSVSTPMNRCFVVWIRSEPLNFERCVNGWKL